MYEIINIGATPSKERCAQVGSNDYNDCSRRECLIYQRMLERLFPLENTVPAQVIVKSFPHDFGSYREVCVRYDANDAAACSYAFQLEAQSLVQWDAIARYELIWLERQQLLQRAVDRDELQPEEVPEAYRSKDFPMLPADRTFSELLAAFPL